MNLRRDPATFPARGIWDECDFQCDCRDGRCIACELKRLWADLPALLARADDACTCEDRGQCAACAIAEVVRSEMKHLTLAHPAPAGTEADPVGRRGASEPQPDTGGSAT